MSSLKPWLHEEVPPEIARLLRAARSDLPRRGVVDRAVLMIASGATIGTATTGALGAVAKVGLTSIGWTVKWGAAALLGIGLGTTAAVTAQYYYSTNDTQAAPTVPAKRATRSSAERDRSTGTAPGVVAPVSEDPNSGTIQEDLRAPPVTSADVLGPSIGRHVDREPTNMREPAPNVAAAAGSSIRHSEGSVVAPTPTEAAQQDLQLAEEMRYLDQARDALRQSRPQDALRWLERYRQHCPAKRMLQEALLLRLRAEMDSGNRSTALATARQIVSQFPQSPHAARARELIATGHFR